MTRKLRARIWHRSILGQMAISPGTAFTKRLAHHLFSNKTCDMSGQIDSPNPNGGRKPIQLTPTRARKRRNQPSPKTKRSQISSEDLQKKTIEDTLKVPAAIKDNYGKGGATWEEIAKAIGVSAKTAENKYL